MGRVPLAVKVAAFTTLYVLAALVGRATVVDDRAMSLVWPATGVAVVWFLTLTSRAGTVWSALVLAGATVAVNVLTRPALGVAPVLVVANLLQVAAVVGLVHRWCPELGIRGGRPPLETPRSLVRFLVATMLGCLAGVLVGVVGLMLLGEAATPATALAWWGRNVCGVLAVGTTGLLLVHRLVGGLPAHAVRGGNAAEAAALVGVTGGLVLGDAGSGLPVMFLLPATTVWAGLRFSPLVVSAHALLGGVAVIWLTLNGDGLFTGSTTRQGDVLLAQAFVGMTIMTGLLLAAGRQESARLHEELHARQRELAAFSRRAAHDLQNPLLVIDGWTRLLSGRLEGPEHEMVGRIQAAAGQMRGLVTDLLADASARDREVVATPVDLGILARDIAEARAATEFVRVGTIPLVLGDATMLRQLLDNLIGNALKYVAPGQLPDVEVTGSADHNRTVTVQVTDRGIGIPPGSHEKIFGDFTRLHAEDYPGTGLGLSICRRIVERHGGELTAAARPSPGGTVFTFRLPAWQHHTGSTPPAGTAGLLERHQPWSTTTSLH